MYYSNAAKKKKKREIIMNKLKKREKFLRFTLSNPWKGKTQNTFYHCEYE